MSSPASRAARSCRSLFSAARSRSGTLTQRAPPSPSKKPSSAANVSRVQASRKRSSSPSLRRGGQTFRAQTARTSEAAVSTAPTARTFSAPPGPSAAESRTSSGKRSVSNLMGRAPRRASAPATRSTVKWSPLCVTSRTASRWLMFGCLRGGACAARRRPSGRGAAAAPRQGRSLAVNALTGVQQVSARPRDGDAPLFRLGPRRRRRVLLVYVGEGEGRVLVVIRRVLERLVARAGAAPHGLDVVRVQHELVPVGRVLEGDGLGGGRWE